jgi:hypothetical protein
MFKEISLSEAQWAIKYGLRIANEEVEMIKKVTKHDVAAGICGTPSEKLLFYTCDKCK